MIQRLSCEFIFNFFPQIFKSFLKYNLKSLLYCTVLAKFVLFIWHPTSRIYNICLNYLYLILCPQEASTAAIEDQAIDSIKRINKIKENLGQFLWSSLWSRSLCVWHSLSVRVLLV